MSDADPRRDSRWWGWGDPAHRVELPASATELLADRIGGTDPTQRSAIEQVRLPDPMPLSDRVRTAAGVNAVYVDHEDRVRHAAGQSYPDLVRLRSGELDEAPDAIVLPADAAAVATLLEACAHERVAVVPFGGGTSVVGGVAPARGGFDSVVSLDLARLRRVEVDRRSLTATLGPGLRGPEAEAALAREGVTLGHYPQSFVYATIGGFAATRSAGQASCGYGRFDELVTSSTLQTPSGELATLETPHTAAGPSLREVVLGSEGALGVITEVTVRVRPAPEAQRYEGWMVPGFEEGMEALRELPLDRHRSSQIKKSLRWRIGLEIIRRSGNWPKSQVDSVNSRL